MTTRIPAAGLLLLLMAMTGLHAVEAMSGEDPLVFAVGKLPPRASGWSCPDREAARTATYERSPGVVSLDGDWRFRWAPRPEAMPAEALLPATDDSAWKTIPVPSQWELQGYGTPLYSNATYPFRADPPRVMGDPPQDWTASAERNPVGVYRRTFTVPAAWSGRRIILHFAGVRSAMELHVNGRRIGYSQDSTSPAEFDVTEAVKAGDNALAVQVWHFCAGSYLEDQDMWRLSGIFRDVFLTSVPAVHLRDWQVWADLADDFRSATLHGVGELNQAPPAGWRVRLHVWDPQGQPLGAGPLIDAAVAAGAASGTGTIAAPVLWTHETPHLYRVVAELVDANGAVVEARGRDVGLRRVQLGPDGFRLNGVVLKIRGVNRHEFDPERGQAITPQSMVDDVCRIKRTHFNSIRTCHYANDPRFYEICDRLGMLVMDEANVETHGLSYHKRVLPGDRPEWRPAVVDRMRRLVVRDRGHACVVMWSLGNEAGYGDAFMAMREEARRLDPELRPIQYADMNLAADMDSQTYPSVDWLEQHMQDKATRKGEQGQKSHEAQHGPYPSGKPFLMNEYAHARGNILGNFQAYWDMMDKYPRLIGGYIWCWHDMPLRRTVDGKRVDAIGGDFGDKPNDADFCMCGIVAGDRTPHPTWYEVRQVQRPVVVSGDAAKPGSITIRNRQAFSGLNDLALKWSLLSDGRKVADIPCPVVEVAPGSERTVDIPLLADLVARTAGEKVLRCDLHLARDTAWATAGTDLGFDEIRLGGAWKPEASGPPAPMTATTGSDGITLANDQGRLRIDAKGCLAAWAVGGRELLAGPAGPDFWRAPTSGDRGWKMDKVMKPWKEAMGQATVEKQERTAADGAVQVATTLALPTVKGRCTVTWLVRSPSEVEVRLVLDACPAGTPDIPRIGMAWTLPGGMRSVSWYGRGPGETYPDRLAAGGLGVWESTVDALIQPYHRPQENGNRSDVRWLHIAAEDRKRTMEFEALGPVLHVSAWPWSQETLESTPSPHLLKPGRDVTLHLDHRQMGLGADNTWSAQPYPAYRLKAQQGYEYGYRVRIRDR